MVHENVDENHGEYRKDRMSDMPSARYYMNMKSLDRNTKDYSVMTGEVNRLGQYVPEAYLDDRNDLKGARLKMLCRTNCLPLMDRIGREVRPQWPKEHRICPMCNAQAVEDVKHFLLDCPAYEDRRRALFGSIDRIVGNFDFNAIPDIMKMYVALGRRTGCARTDERIDRMVKVHLKKCWNKRKPAADAINDVLHTNYVIMSRAR